MKFWVAILLVPYIGFGQINEKLNNKGVSLIDEENFAEALPIFEKLVAENPTISLYRYNRAICYFNLKKLRESLNDYRVLCKSLPDEPEYFFQVGNILEILNETDSVEFYYTVALQLDREDYLKNFKRATFYLKTGQWQKSIYDFNKTIELNPEHFNSYHNRGIAYYKLGQTDKACEDWCQAIIKGSPISSQHLERNCSKYPKACSR